MTEAKAATNHSMPPDRPLIAALSAQEERFRGVLEASPDGFAILRSVRDAHGAIADFVIEYVNPVAARNVTRSPAELVDQSLLQCFPACQTSGIFERYVTVADLGISDTFETFYDSPALTGWFRHVVMQVADGIAVSFSDITDRKHTELALQQQEQHFRVALQTAKLGSWEHDLRTGVLTCSAQCKANFGLPPEAEFTHATLFAALHPDDRPLVQAAIQRSIQTQTDYEMEERCYHPDGSLHWLIVRGQLVYDTQGTPIRLVGVTLDITERKQTEIALRESQALFQSFMNHSPMAAFIKDAAGRYLYANPWVERVYQRSQADLLGKTDFELLPLAIAQQFHSNDAAVLKSGQPMQMLETIPHQDGEHSYMSFKFPFRNGSGQQVLAGVAIDVSERIATEAALRQSETQYRQIVETANEGIWVMDAETRTTYVNYKMAHILGYRPENMLGQPLSRFMFDGDRPTAEHSLQRWQQGLGEQLDFVLQHRTGSPVWVRCNTSPVMTEEQVGSILVMVSDITERKQAEQALERYQLLSEYSRDIVLYFRSTGEILEANQAAVQAYGYDRATLLTLTITDLRALETQDTIPEQFAQASQMGILFETWHRRQDGTLFPVEVNAQSAVIGDESVVLSVIRDITERKRAEAEREQLLAREQAAREAAEAAEQRARFLAEASTTLTSSLDYEYTLRSVAQAAVPTLADWCAVDILKEDGSLERLAITHVDPAKAQWGLELHRRYPPDLSAAHGLAQVLRTGRSEYYPTISDDQIVAVARDPEHLRILREIGFSSAMLVPLQACNRTLGAISFITAESGRSYSPDDLTLAEELARRAAIALDNARLYQEAQQARQAAERAADRTARLQTVTAALSESLTPTQVAEVIVEQSMAALEADAALVALLSEDGTTLSIVRAVGYELYREEAQQLSIHASAPLAEAVRTRQPIWTEPLAQRLTRYPHLADIYRRFPFEAWISLPLVVEGKAVGGLSLSFQQFRQLNQDDRDFVLALSRQCAQAIVRAQLYAAEQQARAEAERANRIKDEFLAVLSHELRSPLNPILGWAKLLQTREFDSTSTRRALETIERNAKLQTQLIDDLLDVSRILRGKMVLEISPINLITVIEAALETVRLAANAKGIDLQFGIVPCSATLADGGVANPESQAANANNLGLEDHTPRPLATPQSSDHPPIGKIIPAKAPLPAPQFTILGDSGRLQQVVWNLLSNAVKFTPSGGHIEIRLEQVGTQAKIQVKDTGKGITPEFLPHVFEYFRQEDGSITRKFGGLGLGLAIVRYLTELHGGTVEAASPGEELGATFTVFLPIATHECANPNAAEAAIAIAETLPLMAVRVLVVDDEADMRELIATILQQSGAVVKVVSSAIAALIALPAFRPDICVSDIGMPEIDGYELLRRIRRLPGEQGQIPAIALTAYAGEINQQQALAAGFQRHIAKPVEPAELVKAIVSLLRS